MLHLRCLIYVNRVLIENRRTLFKRTRKNINQVLRDSSDTETKQKIMNEAIDKCAASFRRFIAVLVRPIYLA